MPVESVYGRLEPLLPLVRYALLGITYDQFRQRYRKYGLGKD